MPGNTDLQYHISRLNQNPQHISCRVNTLFLFQYYYCICRIVVCMAYYGLALNSGDLAGDMFLNFFLQTFMDIPANLIVILLLDKLGRKPLLVGSMVIGGISLMATIFTIIYGGSGKRPYLSPVCLPVKRHIYYYSRQSQLDKLGREPLLEGSMVIGGIALIATILTIIYGGGGKCSYFSPVCLSVNRRIYY